MLEQEPLRSLVELVPWRVREAGDGTFSIEPSRGSQRFLGVLMLLMTGMLQLLFNSLFLMSPPRTAKDWWGFAAFALIVNGVTAVPICLGLKWCFGRETWVVGHHRFDTHNSLFGFRWTRQYQADAFIVQYLSGKGGIVYGLSIVGRKVRPSLLNTPLMTSGQKEQTRAAGQFLSHITGWPLREWTK